MRRQADPVHRGVVIAGVGLAGVALGCQLLGPATQTDTGDADAGASTATPGDHPPVPDSTPCRSTADCEAGFCVADYDPHGDPPVGPAMCVLDCVPPLASHLVCMDHAACCGDTTCGEDGRCRDDSATSDSSSSATGNSTATTGEAIGEPDSPHS